jgi:hypothetical protein
MIPDLGTGFEGAAFHIQSIFMDSGGNTMFGPGQSLVVLSDLY